MSWSSLPGLRMAGSMMSGLFVAPIINTFFLADIPSISVRIWLITRSAAPPIDSSQEVKELILDFPSVLLENIFFNKYY